MSVGTPVKTFNRDDAVGLRNAVKRIVTETPVTDMHTHLYAPAFGELLLWGVDELLTYHYLIAEFFRLSDMSYADFWSLDKTRQADAIWQTLFIENAPISEACRGVSEPRENTRTSTWPATSSSRPSSSAMSGS